MRSFLCRKAFICLSAAVLCVAVFVALFTHFENASVSPKARTGAGEIKSAPYPFESMLAVCSDIDGTTLREFEVIHKYLNTVEEDTYLGKGLGLDIADSFFMYAVNDNGEVIDYDGAQNAAAMSYYRPGASELKNDKEIIHYFNSGWIDAIHSYGDFSRLDTSKPVFTQKHAEMANSEMIKNSLLPSIWINHGNKANVQNIRKSFSLPKLWYQQGASKSSEYYHADFTIASGIKYVWFSNPGTRFAVETPLYPAKLNDGQMVWGFNRYTGEKKYFGLFGHSYNWSSFNFNEQVAKEHLDELVSSGGVAVVAQHFGAANGDYVFTGETKEGFKRLKSYEDSGKILIARTSRLLEFVRVRDNLNYEYEINDNGEETITIYSVSDPVLGVENVTEPMQLAGVSFNVLNPQKAKILLEGGVNIDESYIIRSGSEEARGVIGIKWYDKDLTDYTEHDAVK